MIGATLSRYRILDKLGEGGMGEVYVAEDSELGRKVALKVLRSEAAGDRELLERFRREARAVAALNHPNIVTIYSVESAEVEDDGAPPEGGPVDFLTMELVEGRRLDQLVPEGGLPAERIFEIGAAIGDALHSAHKNGITHRDLKPANVMINDEGRVKILDFGLARLQREAGGEDESTEVLTQTGLVMGTVPYMSPEQIGGSEIDHRTDIFSLGVLLYEMATGERPFRGESSGHVISAILRDEPPPVTEVRSELPFHLGRIVRRCLEKEPDQRYQAALDVRNELESLRKELESGVVSPLSEALPAAARRPARRRWPWLAAAAALLVLALLAVWVGRRERPAGSVPEPAETAAAAEDKATVVVLPFENLGPPEDEYFAAGITEEITSRLASVRDLRVISRNSAMRYASTDKTLQQIGEELGAGYVLEGRIRWARSADGSRVRITPQLIRVEDDIQLWGSSYDRVLADVFEVQSEIADQVTRELGIAMRGARGEAPPTDDPEAYQAYLRGLDHERQLDPERRELAIAMFERAVELDPEFVEAWAKLVQIFANRHFNSDFRQEWLRQATEALERARAVAPDAPAVRLAEGFYEYYGHQRFDRALEIFEELARERPNDVEVVSAIGYIHRRQGRLEEAAADLEKALTLDPQNISLLRGQAEIYRALRRFEKAIEYADRGLALAPDQDAFFQMKARYLADWRGRTEAAREVLSQAPGSADDLYNAWIDLDLLDGEFERALERLEDVPGDDPVNRINLPIQRGLVRWLMGRREAAREDFEEGVRRLDEVLGTSADSTLLAARAAMYAGLGRREEALRDVDRAYEAIASDRFRGPTILETKALLLQFLGENERALDLVDELLGTSYDSAITVARLRHGTLWAALRESPGFDAVLARHEE